MTAILGFTASTYGAGFSFGGSILPGLLASIGSVGFIAAFALRAANAVGPAVGAGMGTMFDAVTSVGQRAERIFRDSTSKAFAAYSIPSSTVNPATISIRLRNVYIKGPIYSSFGILAICILIFLIGAYQGYDQYQNCMTFADSLEEMGRCRSGRSG